MNISNKKPLLSIITVTFNSIDSIEKTIKSVLNQTYKNIEYIIIDGGSTDNTVNVIKKYQTEISYWISEPDNGIFDAMNKGVLHSNGEFVAFMNSGDFYEPDACEIMANYINNNLNAGVFYGNTNVIISTFNSLYAYNVSPPSLIDDKIMIAPVFCHQSSFVKKELFLEYGFFENVKIAGDWLHFILLYTNEIKFVYINKTIANYLAGGASTTIKGFKESFPFKKQFGTFRKKDYLTLFFFHVKDNYVFRNLIDPFLWHFKIFLNPSKYKKITDE